MRLMKNTTGRICDLNQHQERAVNIRRQGVGVGQKWSFTLLSIDSKYTFVVLGATTQSVMTQQVFWLLQPIKMHLL